MSDFGAVKLPLDIQGFPSENMYHQAKAVKGRHLIERRKRCALFGLAIGILFGFLLCMWSKPLFPCTVGQCCLKQQLRAEIRHEIDVQLHEVVKDEIVATKRVSQILLPTN